MCRKHLEVLFTPTEFDRLGQRDLRQTQCVVIDVLRATSSMVTALARGAAMIIPVAEIAEALAWRQRDRRILLAGERYGVRIETEMTGEAPFDFGNSPREFSAERVGGKTIAMTTTNGTRALRACAEAHSVLVASFLNLKATVKYLQAATIPNLLLVCGGTFEEAATRISFVPVPLLIPSPRRQPSRPIQRWLRGRFIVWNDIIYPPQFQNLEMASAC